MELTAENVNRILMDCLFRNKELEEDIPPYTKGTGIKGRLLFHPERLASHKADIEAMCDQLSDDFKKAGGGGSSFLNASITKDGRQWGEHSNIDELLCLGTAIGKIAFLMPRELWSALPGGMPYFVVN